MVKVWFPSMFMRLIGTDLKKSPALATLQVSPRMTKTEVREYLTKVYDICVLKVNTENVAGKISCFCFSVAVDCNFLIAKFDQVDGSDCMVSETQKHTEEEIISLLMCSMIPTVFHL